MRKVSTLLFLFMSTSGFTQDFLRTGVAIDFQKDKIVQTFSFDFNRTEKVDEKVGGYLKYTKNNFYISPTTDINLGDGITSSENNVLLQINMGQAFLDTTPIKNKDKSRATYFNHAIELNPSYTSDKLFKEKLAYGQLKYLFNIVSTKHTTDVTNFYLKSVNSISLGVFVNTGYRYSSSYEIDNFYSTLGALIEYKTRILNSKKKDSWVFKLTANYYGIASDVRQLTTQKYAGLLKASVDKLLFGQLFVGFSYKYGNDNPTYKTVHTLEFSLKLNISKN